ncbi:hypothetical protein B0J11DRAFT_85448 [Dendryphion nanum]|uniref:Uncharacterized protein n=1 Tax=Dendryphion nanum TaxID=256645 RepID=A0A9P9IGF8_9PLEO|nr:hypothetical protein B0J11DRAFT_85448 [Dendryphion nanum]
MDSKSLKASKYAPRTPAETLAQNRAERLGNDKTSAVRLFGRLRWKAESLKASYSRANDIITGGRQYDYLSGLDNIYIESMFKVDFFEFYSLLERYITLCLSIRGIYIPSNAPSNNVNALRFITNPEFARLRPEASHRFHENLLDALEKEDSPFHTSLGRADVRTQLRIAKDYRNRWKDADEKAAFKNGHSHLHREELDLGVMLFVLLTACEQALSVVKSSESSAQTIQGESRNLDLPYHENKSIDEDIPFEFMDDAMDLD